MDETMVLDPDDDDEVHRLSVRFESKPVTCHACAARDRAVKKATDGNKEIPPGTKWRTSSRD